MVCPEKLEGKAWNLYLSSFRAETADANSEQEKAALQAKVDARDPSYSRSEVEESKANIFNNYRFIAAKRYSQMFFSGETRNRLTWHFPTPEEFINRYSFASENTPSPVPPTATAPASPSASSTPTPSFEPTSDILLYVTIDPDNGTEPFQVEASEIRSFMNDYHISQTKPGYVLRRWVNDDGSSIIIFDESLGGHTITAIWEYYPDLP